MVDNVNRRGATARDATGTILSIIGIAGAAAWVLLVGIDVYGPYIEMLLP